MHPLCAKHEFMCDVVCGLWFVVLNELMICFISSAAYCVPHSHPKRIVHVVHDSHIVHAFRLNMHYVMFICCSAFQQITNRR